MLKQLILIAGAVVLTLTLADNEARSEGKTKLGPNPIRCPAKLTCKVPSRGVDFPVCHEGDKPPTCSDDADCVKKGLGAKSCTSVAPFFSLCVQACTP